MICVNERHYVDGHHICDAALEPQLILSDAAQFDVGFNGHQVCK